MIRFSIYISSRKHRLPIPTKSALIVHSEYPSGGLNLDAGHFGQLSEPELTFQIAGSNRIHSCSHVPVPDCIPVLLLPVSRIH